MGLPSVRELTLRSNLIEVFLPGMHVEALTRICKGQAAHEMGVLLDEFFGHPHASACLDVTAVSPGLQL